jgi:hypothetical protein
MAVAAAAHSSKAIKQRQKYYYNSFITELLLLAAMQRAVGRSFVGNIGKRTFAGEAASHAPPKKLHGTTGRYAGAVYTAASKVRY